MPSKTVAHHRARVAALTRSRQPNDPELVAARQALDYQGLAEHAQRVVSTWPDPTPEQLERVASLLLLSGGAR